MDWRPDNVDFPLEDKHKCYFLRVINDSFVTPLEQCCFNACTTGIGNEDDLPARLSVPRARAGAPRARSSVEVSNLNSDG